MRNLVRAAAKVISFYNHVKAPSELNAINASWCRGARRLQKNGDPLHMADVNHDECGLWRWDGFELGEINNQSSVRLTQAVVPRSFS